MRIEARDGGSPQKTDITQAIITVERNLRTPRWDKETYNKNILETFPVGDTILTLEADDRDERGPYNQLEYRMADGVDQRVSNFFGVDLYSGRIFLKKSLLLSNLQTFGVIGLFLQFFFV